MIRRPLALALAMALLSPSAFAEDLLQTYELARASDPLLSAAESGRLATKEGAVQARAALLPSLTGNASIGRTRNDSSGTRQQFIGNPPQPITFRSESESEDTSRSVGVGLRQMVFDRSNFTRLKSQSALSRSADFQLKSAGDDLLTRTSQAYFNVLVAMETLAAAEAQEAALKKQFDFASKRLEVGLAPITDVHEARAQYDGARANTIVTRNALEDAEQALAEITGQTIANLKALPQDFQPQLPPNQGVDQWVTAAVDNNPALKAKEFQVLSASADVDTARAARWPTLYLSGGYNDSKNWGETRFSGLRLPSESTGRGANLGLELSVPLFTGGLISSQVRQATALRDVATDELDQQRRALVRNTRNAYQTLVAGVAEVEARRSAVTSAREAYAASQVGLEVGTRNVLDVLLNQQTLFEAQREYAISRYSFLQNRLMLEQAAGSLDIEDVQEVNRLLTTDASAQAMPEAESSTQSNIPSDRTQ